MNRLERGIKFAFIGTIINWDNYSIMKLCELHKLMIYINDMVFFIISDYVNGGELFTHLYQREHFSEDDVRTYIGEIVLALETLHKVSEL